MAFPLDLPKIVAPSDDAWWLLRQHLGWIGFNCILGIVPWVMGRVLFAPTRRPGVLWLAGVIAFVAWVPNLPYLLTDVIHVPEAIGDTPNHAFAAAVLVPVFTIFFAAWYLAYTDVCRLARAHLPLVTGGRLSPRAVDALAHLTCGTGVVVGRATHAQTWDLVREPMSVSGQSFAALASPSRIGLALLTAGVLASVVRPARLDGDRRRGEAARALPRPGPSSGPRRFRLQRNSGMTFSAKSRNVSVSG